MKKANVELENGVITRFEVPKPEKSPATKSAPAKPAKPILQQKNLSLDDYASIYHNENLYEVDNVKYPFVLISSTKNLKNQTAELYPESYQIPTWLNQFKRHVLEYKLSPSAFNGDSARLMDLETDGEKTHVRLQHVKYFNHIATDLSKDVFLEQFQLSEKTTLRDYELAEGKAKPALKSNLANLVCPPFILISEEKDKEYLLLTQRRKDLAVEAGTFSILGGTTEWKGIIKLGGDNWKDYFRYIANQEMREEVCLDSQEFEIEKIAWWKDFTRAPDVLICMRTKVPIEKLAKRIEKDPIEAQKEHPYIYRVPADPTLIKEIRTGDRFNLNNPSKVFLEWYFNN